MIKSHCTHYPTCGETRVTITYEEHFKDFYVLSVKNMTFTAFQAIVTYECNELNPNIEVREIKELAIRLFFDILNLEI